jgi:hypothetical protein
MPSETTSQISPAVLIYLGMGAVTAKILFESANVSGKKTWLEWLQFLVRAGSIVLLWPLVLFLEKFEIWLKSTEQEKK